MDASMVKSIAKGYLVRILNSKTKENEIKSIIRELKVRYPNNFSEILREIRSNLEEFTSSDYRGVEKRSRKLFEQSNDDYLEYLILLSKAIENTEKK